ncbi:hypothetical protein HTG_13225 [Natrinema mahii]|nr:hypothetical protein HTG_13225 [Natrinema mahii]
MEWLSAYNGVLIRVGLYLLIFWPTVGYYVYEDSKKRGFFSPKIRGIAYWFLGVLGLFIYLSQKARANTNSI